MKGICSTSPVVLEYEPLLLILQMAIISNPSVKERRPHCFSSPPLRSIWKVMVVVQFEVLLQNKKTSLLASFLYHLPFTHQPEN